MSKPVQLRRARNASPNPPGTRKNKYGGGGPAPQRAVDKFADAMIRQEKHNNLTTQQKLDKLDKRLGKGVGAVRERRVLEDLLSQEKKLAMAPKPEPVQAEKPKSKKNYQKPKKS